MRKSLIACLAAAAASVPVGHAASGALKPGLWEVRIIKQVVDGRDMSAEIAASNQHMQQALAHLPPEQRAKVESMLKKRGISSGPAGGFRVCITPKMAKRRSPILEKEGHCHMTHVAHHANRTTFAFACTSKGVTTTGTGDTTRSSELVKTRTDATTESPHGGKHILHSETEMRFLKSDCGDVQPPPQPQPSR